MSDGSGPSVVVLGAGIQGSCVALEMSQAGWNVDLVDRALAPMRGTSARGEGKLHLGYVYANDPSRRTASLMLDGSSSFSAILDRLLPGRLDWRMLRSDPFVYAVPPNTMVSVDALTEHYEWVDTRLDVLLGEGARYAGRSSVKPVRRLDTHACLDTGGLLAAFQTAEVAIDPVVLGREVIAGLNANRVVFRGMAMVRSVQRTAEGLEVCCTGADGAALTYRADAVVNCLWNGRLAIDATMGILPERPFAYRLKYAVHGQLPGGVPPPASTTVVLGPFGDVVRYRTGRIYASWYPSCLAGWSTEVDVPEEWQRAMSGQATDSIKEEIAAATVEALTHFVPTLRQLQVDAVAAGVIVAWGDSDIHEPSSELHHRHEIGVHDHDGYLSVDTGKLTMAPLFAQQVRSVLVGSVA